MQVTVSFYLFLSQLSRASFMEVLGVNMSRKLTEALVDVVAGLLIVGVELEACKRILQLQYPEVDQKLE